MTGFTSVLKKIGQTILTASGIATEVMQFPFVSSLLTGAASKLGATGTAITTGIGDLNSVAQIISMMEVAFPNVNGPTGSAKLAAAAPLVQQVILNWAQSNLPGHDIIKVDPATFAEHCAAFTSDFANLMNDFGD